MKKRWKVAEADKGLAGTLAREMGILPLTAQLLINRGILDSAAASAYLRPSLSALPDPFLLKDMDRAVERVRLALDRNERIAVWGDYDVDGATSSALLHLFFKEIGVEAECYIPERRSEGYGLNPEGLKRLKDAGASLVITVDCGSTNHDAVGYANSIGLDVIITDHHEIPEPLPAACAVINPKQHGCAYPYKGLAGVGVAFNLAVALRARLRSAGRFNGTEPNLRKYLDLVCIGTVADVAPLTGVNRLMTSAGLCEMASGARPGIGALIETARLSGPVTAGNIAYQLAPRLNAAGRLKRAETALKLLVTAEAAEAASIAAELDSENTARRKIEEEMFREALLMLGADAPDKGVVLSKEGWHPGVIGIVASRLAERLARPVVMIALEDGVGKGSARGAASFNVVEGLRACGRLLTRFGGHKAAAGLTVDAGNVELFRREFISHVNAAIPDEELTPVVRLDAAVTLGDVNERLVNETAALAPFGAGNPEPLLCLLGAHIVSTEVVGGGRHLRLKVQDAARPGPVLSGIGFGLASCAAPVKGAAHALAFSPYMDEWRGGRTLKLRIKDVQAVEGQKF
ncbi:MAG: single-stranded-DNA-specific exonuclease RecJ [Deltaproteobacteria bacterium]|nr:single-stranded-DNA-specific exonuclease RecJ [Deltaproteobacteria bacterium]